MRPVNREDIREMAAISERLREIADDIRGRAGISATTDSVLTTAMEAVLDARISLHREWNYALFCEKAEAA
jgi:hypothetical protein